MHGYRGGGMAGTKENEWGGQGGVWKLFGNDQAHGRTYGEGQRMDGRLSGNCYPFRYVQYYTYQEERRTQVRAVGGWLRPTLAWLYSNIPGGISREMLVYCWVLPCPQQHGYHQYCCHGHRTEPLQVCATCGWVF